MRMRKVQAARWLVIMAAHTNINQFTVGNKFSTFAEFEDRLESFEQQSYTQWWKRDCCTVERARKRLVRYLSDDIHYYSVKYKCVHGGRKFKSKGEGIRSTM